MATTALAPPPISAPAPLRGDTERESSYLQYLPAIYREDGFLRRFLLIFEDILGPLQRLVDNLPYYCDPATAPSSFLPWLATWVDMDLGHRLSTAQQRELVQAAAYLHRQRGTRAGLKRYVKICTGVEPLVIENSSGLRLGPDARLGWNACLGRPLPYTIAITLPCQNPDAIDTAMVEAVTADYKPAHIGYTLKVVQRRDGTTAME